MITPPQLNPVRRYREAGRDATTGTIRRHSVPMTTSATTSATAAASGPMFPSIWS